jgi:hypothetical protein
LGLRRRRSPPIDQLAHDVVVSVARSPLISGRSEYEDGDDRRRYWRRPVLRSLAYGRRCWRAVERYRPWSGVSPVSSCESTSWDRRQKRGPSPQHSPCWRGPGHSPWSAGCGSPGGGQIATSGTVAQSGDGGRRRAGLRPAFWYCRCAFSIGVAGNFTGPGFLASGRVLLVLMKAQAVLGAPDRAPGRCTGAFFVTDSKIRRSKQQYR